MRRRGIDASKMSQLGSLLGEAQLSTIQTATKTIPLGYWGGRVGNLFAQDLLAGWPHMRSLAHSLLNVSEAMFDETIGRLETEWNSYQTTYEVYFACGRV